jgi:2-polyprenyl-6-methoxyphenol hydroxylase-like FAD-dependent oxidoreductase
MFPGWPRAPANRLTAVPAERRGHLVPDGGGATGATTPVPAYLHGDDPVGTPPDRQILVVGDAVAGLALAVVLDCAGFDPVLVGDADAAPITRCSWLWPTARRLLAAVDADCDATVPDAVVVRDGDDERRIDPVESPALVSTADLRQTLRSALTAGTHRPNRSVATVRERADADALEITFDNGVRESFDLVVRTARATESGGNARQFEQVVTPATPLEHSLAVDGSATLTEGLPLPDGRALLRTTTTEHDSTTAVLAHWQEALPNVLGPTDAGATEPTVRQVSVDGSIAEHGDGRVARCGPAATSLAPATTRRATVAVEDAWVLTDELVGGPPSIPAAVDAYRRRRGRRLDGLFDAADAATAERPIDGPLATVTGLRRAALESAHVRLSEL